MTHEINYMYMHIIIGRPLDIIVTCLDIAHFPIEIRYPSIHGQATICPPEIQNVVSGPALASSHHLQMAPCTDGVSRIDGAQGLCAEHWHCILQH